MPTPPKKVYSDDEVDLAAAPRVYSDDEIMLDDTPSQPVRLLGRSPLEVLGEKVAPRAKEFGIGALKSAGEGVFRLGKAVRDYTPIGRISDAIQPGAFNTVPPELERKGAWQNLGGLAEQTGEMALGGSGLLRGAATAVASSKLHGASNTEAGAAGAITATLPAALKGVTRFAGAMRGSAERTMSRAITPGGGSKDIKREAARIVPMMLDKGVRGTADSMAQRASNAVDDIGPKIGQAYKDAAAQGATVPGQKIVAALQAEKSKYLIPDAMGVLIPKRGAERIVKELDGFSDFVSSLAPDIPVDEAAGLKTTWQTVAAAGNQYVPGQAGGVTSPARAYVSKKGAQAIRGVLDNIQGLGDIRKLNDEYAFWKGLGKVLQATQLRSVGHTGGLFTGMAGTAGGVVGVTQGDNIESRAVNAITGIAVSRALVRAVTSPWWRTTLSAPFKDALSKALASDSMEEALKIANRASAASVSQFKSSTTAKP